MKKMLHSYKKVKKKRNVSEIKKKRGGKCETGKNKIIAETEKKKQKDEQK